MHASTWQLMSRSAREGRDRLDRIDDALRVLRSGADHQHGAIGDRAGHRVDVGAVAVSDGHPHGLHAEVVRGLLERSVCGCGQHHLGIGDVALAPPSLACGFHGHEQALGAAGRQEPGGVISAVHEVRDHAHDLRLEAATAREGIGIESVVVHERDEGVGLEVEHVLASVVREGEGRALIASRRLACASRRARPRPRHGNARARVAGSWRLGEREVQTGE